MASEAPRPVAQVVRVPRALADVVVRAVAELDALVVLVEPRAQSDQRLKQTDVSLPGCSGTSCIRSKC